jgi:hypothetical protein
MSVNKFMENKLDVIKNKLINNIPNDTFDSQEFISYFAKEFEVEYVSFLSKYDDEPFRKVHVQIALFLSVNKELLNLKDDGTSRRTV